MDILRRALAPISTEAWQLIDATAKDALSTNLSARKFVDFDGPHGLAYAAVPQGRLNVVQETTSKTLGYGVHKVQPLAETRLYFDLPLWELDNIARGAKDIDLDPLLEACRTVAGFEDAAVFSGLEPAGITGLHTVVAGRQIPLRLDADAIIDAVGAAQGQLLKAGVAGGYNLVVNLALLKFLAHPVAGGTLRTLIEAQIGGRVLYSAAVKDALLVAARGGDAVLTVGQDLAIGYHTQTSSAVTLFLTESFTFRVITPEAVVGFVLS
ncbi:MAG: family 1 encapsulin nanocompartment shell protein [Rhizomicrobium sp.]